MDHPQVVFPKRPDDVLLYQSKLLIAIFLMHKDEITLFPPPGFPRLRNLWKNTSKLSRKRFLRPAYADSCMGRIHIGQQNEKGRRIRPHRSLLKSQATSEREEALSFRSKYITQGITFRQFLMKCAKKYAVSWKYTGADCASISGKPAGMEPSSR